MPLTRKTTNDETGEEDLYISAFVWKPRWFVLSQTDGEPAPVPEMPEWDKERALKSLGIEEIPFTHTNGNTQGFSRGNKIAVSPLAAFPIRPFFTRSRIYVVFEVIDDSKASELGITIRDHKQCAAVFTKLR
ncbi:MAG: hypothetical protein DMF61_11260 [Blastocatellia bacterium AA13]|nr:MAG: hypothetical protein DMF61_11260 [Blastocatellia bacterium AA13]